ncbi:MAG: hypothetical protein Q3966_06535 [Neisseria sp.]|nr:hypothetical protein [Neisseria sp.]
MKWLFFVLVALNIAIFGGMVAPQLLARQEAEMIARRNQADTKLEVHSPQPMVKPKDAQTAEPAEKTASGAQAASSAAGPDGWISDNGGAQDVYIEPEDTEEEAARRIQEREKWQLAEKERTRKREEAARRSANGGNGGAVDFDNGIRGGGKQCFSTASVTLPEDDYHRIKGLLNQWPHAASRQIERREAAKGRGKGGFIVWTPIQVDAGSQIQALKAKGFSASLMDGGISVGSRPDRAQAQALLSRLQGAGFSGQLRELEGGGIGGQSVAKMQVTFMNVDDKAAQSIQGIVGRYGSLHRNRCR